MDKFSKELQRLYFLPDQGAIETSSPIVRCLLISLERSGDWSSLARLYEAVQSELELPAPAVSVSSRNGFRLWFSLKEGVSLAQAEGFLQALCRKHLADVPEKYLKLFPGSLAADGEAVEIPPRFNESVEKWSAFIDPSLGSMFADEAGLDMPPNPDKQAAQLAECASIDADDFQRALATLLPGEKRDSEMAINRIESGRGSPGLIELLPVGTSFTDPYSFLLAVMNDATVSAVNRIEAAKALLPYSQVNNKSDN
jgi:hypothetical protein